MKQVCKFCGKEYECSYDFIQNYSNFYDRDVVWDLENFCSRDCHLKAIELKLSKDYKYYYTSLLPDTKLASKIDNYYKNFIIEPNRKCLNCGKPLLGTEELVKNSDEKFKHRNIYYCSYHCQRSFTGCISQLQHRMTCKSRYGCEHHWSNEEVKKKRESTFLELYGSTCPLGSKELREKWSKDYDTSNYSSLKKRNLEVYNLLNDKERLIKFIESSDKKSLCYLASKLDVARSVLSHYICMYDIDYLLSDKYCSGIEFYIRDFLDKLGIKYYANSRDVLSHNREIDIYIPDKKLGIELNGVYWHDHNHKPSDYHIKKLEDAESKGIQLLNFWETEVYNKLDIIKSVILNKLGLSNRVYARNLKVKFIEDKDKVNKFLDNNHMQGSCISKVDIALVDNNDEIYSLMTFSKPRFNKNYDWELLRFCNKLNTTVVGGASKLLSHFMKLYKGNIISYANRRWSQGNLYKQLGFTFKNSVGAGYYYYKDGIIHHRVEFQKHKLKDKLEVFDENKTEIENMLDNGYTMLYDCGNLVYERLNVEKKKEENEIKE